MDSMDLLTLFCFLQRSERKTGLELIHLIIFIINILPLLSLPTGNDLVTNEKKLEERCSVSFWL